MLEMFLSSEFMSSKIQIIISWRLIYINLNTNIYIYIINITMQLPVVSFSLSVLNSNGLNLFLANLTPYKIKYKLCKQMQLVKLISLQR